MQIDVSTSASYKSPVFCFNHKICFN